MRRNHRKNYNDPGHAHELTFSCYQRFEFLKSDRTCQWLVASLTEARQKCDFDLWAYVFMPDHVHVIVHPRKSIYDISAIRKAIKSPVATLAIRHLELHAPQWLLKITRQRGRRVERLFWQSGGGYDRNIIESETLLTMIDYIHLNPVRKGLVQHACDWRWSSASWYAGVRADRPIAIDPIGSDWLSQSKV